MLRHPYEDLHGTHLATRFQFAVGPWLVFIISLEVEEIFNFIKFYKTDKLQPQPPKMFQCVWKAAV